MSKTIGERVDQWLKNYIVLATLLGGTIYGNSDTVKEWVGGDSHRPLKPPVIEPAKPIPESDNEIMKLIEAQNIQIEAMKKQIARNKNWHE